MINSYTEWYKKVTPNKKYQLITNDSIQNYMKKVQIKNEPQTKQTKNENIETNIPFLIYWLQIKEY